MLGKSEMLTDNEVLRREVPVLANFISDSFVPVLDIWKFAGYEFLEFGKGHQ